MTTRIIATLLVYVPLLAITVPLNAAMARRRGLPPWPWIGWAVQDTRWSTAALAGKRLAGASGGFRWGAAALVGVPFLAGSLALSAFVQSSLAVAGRQNAPPLADADWPAVQQAPLAYTGRHVLLDAQVASVLADTAGRSVQGFTQYGDTNPLDATTFTLAAGAKVAADGSFVRIPGTVAGAEAVQNAFGAKYTEAAVAVTAATPETCAQAFGASACG